MPRRTSFNRTAVIAVATVLAAAWAAAPAQADYTVESCRDSVGAPLDATLWTAGGGSGSQEDSCADPAGALTAELPGGTVAAGATSGYRLVVPNGVTLAGGELWLDATTQPTPAGSQLAAGAAFAEGFAGAAVSGGCPATEGGCTVGHADPPADANIVGVPAGAAGVLVLARCTVTTAADCLTDTSPGPVPPAARVRLYRSALTVEDGTAPGVGAITGTAAATGPLRGTVSVQAETTDTGGTGGTDSGGGILRRVLLVDGAAVQTAAGTGTCQVPFTRFTPCPASQTAAFDLDTTTLSEGGHRIAVRAVDAAGLVTDGPERGVTVDNVPPDPEPTAEPTVVPTAEPTAVPTAAPTAAPTATATAAPVIRVPARVLLPVRRALPSRAVTGGVIDSAGRPLAGIPVALVQRPIGRPKATWRAVASVRTDSKGRFKVPGGGVSRVVRAVAVFPGSKAKPADIEFVQRRTLTLAAPGTVLRNGEVVTLRGRVRGTGGSARGQLVVIEAIVGGRWREVDRVRTGAGGTIRWRYRLRNSTRAANYRFRVRVPRVRRLPWRTAVSGAVVVKVRPR